MERRDLLFMLGGFAAYTSMEGLRNGTSVALAYPKRNFDQTFSDISQGAVCKDQVEVSKLVGFGDSNMEGTFVRGKRSLPEAIATYANENGVGSWQGHNFGYRGAVMKDISGEQVVRPGIIDFLAKQGEFEVLVNAGGNDLAKIIDTPKKAADLTEVLDQPFQWETLKIINETYGVLEKYSSGFLEVLEAIERQFGSQITKYNILSTPNFSQAKALRTDLIEGESHEYALNTASRRWIVQNISILINNSIADATAQFRSRNPDLATRVINIYGLSQGDFLGDEHFNFRGQDKIAKLFFEQCSDDDK